MVDLSLFIHIFFYEIHLCRNINQVVVINNTNCISTNRKKIYYGEKKTMMTLRAFFYINHSYLIMKN